VAPASTTKTLRGGQPRRTLRAEIGGTIFRGDHLGDDEASRIIETLLRGAAVDYDALVAHGRRIKQEHTILCSTC
jgi:hypothetical protein